MNNLFFSKINDEKSKNFQKVVATDVENNYCGVMYRSLPGGNDVRGTARMKMYRSLQELKSDIFYRLGAGVKAVLKGKEVVHMLTFDFDKKETPNGTKFLIKDDAKYISFEDYADIQPEPMKGDVQTIYSFVAESGFREAVTHNGKPIVGSKISGKRTFVAEVDGDGNRFNDDGEQLTSDYVPLYRQVKVVDYPNDDYDKKIYSEKSVAILAANAGRTAETQQVEKQQVEKQQEKKQQEKEEFEMAMPTPDSGADIGF